MRGLPHYLRISGVLRPSILASWLSRRLLDKLLLLSLHTHLLLLENHIGHLTLHWNTLLGKIHSRILHPLLLKHSSRLRLLKLHLRIRLRLNSHYWWSWNPLLIHLLLLT